MIRQSGTHFAETDHAAQKESGPLSAAGERLGRGRSRLVLRSVAVGALALLTANCSSQKTAGSAVDPKYGVAASPRVVDEGDAVPKGGGRALVGRPYVVAGRTYVPQDNPGYVREGLASWYGLAFHGRQTANGEIFDRYSVAAAHPTMPLPSYARVTNLQNNRSMIVRVNDRGPYHANRIMDVSERVADALDFKRAGTARVRIEYVSRASLRGSDDAKLMATLRQDGKPVPGLTGPVMVADGARPGAAPPRQALAFRDSGPGGRKDPGFDPLAHVFQPDPVASPAAPAAVAAVQAAPAPTTSAIGRLFSNVMPLPPERPIDLMTIPNAGSPVRKNTTPVAQLRPARPAYAGLFYAAPDLPRSSFSKDDPFKNMKPQRFVAFKGQP
jgi:rare lipoprotein A